MNSAFPSINLKLLNLFQIRQVVSSKWFSTIWCKNHHAGPTTKHKNATTLNGAIILMPNKGI